MGVDFGCAGINKMIHGMGIMVPIGVGIAGKDLDEVADGGDVVEGADVLLRAVGLALERWLVERDESVDGVGEAEVRRCESDISAMAVSNDVQLFSGR